MNKNVTIRPEQHKDYKDIVSLILRSFQEGTDYSDGSDIMIPGSKGQIGIRACTKCLLNLGPAKHEKVAIYVVNQRISNVCRIARVALQRSNS